MILILNSFSMLLMCGVVLLFFVSDKIQRKFPALLDFSESRFHFSRNWHSVSTKIIYNVFDQLLLKKEEKGDATCMSSFNWYSLKGSFWFVYHLVADTLLQYWKSSVSWSSAYHLFPWGKYVVVLYRVLCCVQLGCFSLLIIFALGSCIMRPSFHFGQKWNSGFVQVLLMLSLNFSLYLFTPWLKKEEYTIFPLLRTI